MTDIHTKLLEAGYTHDGKTEAGDRYHNGSYTVYHSGHMLIFRRNGGMTRPFHENRLEHFTVSDIERQTGIIPRVFNGEEDKVNYDFPNKRRP